MSEHCLIKKNTPELRKKLEDDEFINMCKQIKGK
jgi:hypothetical protein